MLLYQGVLSSPGLGRVCVPPTPSSLQFQIKGPLGESTHPYVYSFR